MLLELSASVNWDCDCFLRRRTQINTDLGFGGSGSVGLLTGGNEGNRAKVRGALFGLVFCRRRDPMEVKQAL